MTPTAMDRVLHLRDGRRLGYAEYGMPEGRPVLFFHGTPGSRRQVHADMSATAAELGIRLITPERPGYGHSDQLPGRTVLNWAADVAALTDALTIDRFSIVGFSSGGTYALACAHELPRRVERLSLVGGLAPMNAPEVMVGMAPQVSGTFALARSDPDGLRNALAPMVSSSRAYLAAVAEFMPESDRILLHQREAKHANDLAEALRNGVNGIISDFVLAAQPWGFSPGAIETPVHLWQGAVDCNVPPAMARYLTTVLPKHELSIMPDEGHLMIFTHWREILARMRD